jgi:type IV pilus assembly protein PilA
MLTPLKYRDAKKEEGFTLIELLVVVIIIGILAAIAIPVFLRQRERAWAGSVESDLRNSAIQMETSFTQNGFYPGETDAQATFTEAQLPSQNVTLLVVTPTDAAQATSQNFCVEGRHAQLLDASGDPVVFSYNSALGGVQAEGTACPTT